MKDLQNDFGIIMKEVAMKLIRAVFFRAAFLCFIAFFSGFEVHRFLVRGSLSDFLKAVRSAQYVVDLNGGQGTFIEGLRRVKKGEGEVYAFFVELGGLNETSNVCVRVDRTSCPAVISIEEVANNISSEKED